RRRTARGSARSRGSGPGARPRRPGWRRGSAPGGWPPGQRRGRTREVLQGRGRPLQVTPPVKDVIRGALTVLRTTMKTCGCGRGRPAVAPAEHRLRAAGPAEVGRIASGLCGPGLLAQVITAKYADHAPLHRLAGQLARCGVNIARSTLGGWLAQVADLLGP